MPLVMLTKLIKRILTMVWFPSYLFVVAVKITPEAVIAITTKTLPKTKMEPSQS